MAETYPKIVPSSVDIRPRVSGTNSVGTLSNPFAQIHSHSLFVSGVGIYTVSQIPTTGNFPNAPSGSLGLSSNGSGIYYFGNNPVSGTWNQFVTSDASGNYNITINDPRLSPAQLIYVQQNPGSGQFSSINTALASITDATANKPYAILVEPGHYVEPELNVDPYIHIIGRDQAAVTISPSGVHNVFNLSTNSSLSFLSIFDAPAGHYGVDTVNPGDYVLLHKVTFDNCDIGMRAFADNGATDNNVYLEYVDSTNNNSTTAGFLFQNDDPLGSLYVAAENFYVYGDITNPPVGIRLIGVGTSLATKAAGIEGINGSGHAVVVQSGASLIAGVLGFSNWATGVYVPQDAESPSVILNSTPFADITNYNVYIENSGTSGYMVAYTPLDKQFINEDNDFFMTYRKSHIISVAEKGGDFRNIYQAIDYLNSQVAYPPSVTQRYLIQVSPDNIYYEPEMTVPEFVSIAGDEQYPVRIAPSGNHSLFHIGQNTTLSFMTIQDVPTGYYGIVSTNPGDFTLINKVAFENCWSAAKVIATSGTVNAFYFEYADTTQDNTLGPGFEFISVSGTPLSISCENWYVIAGDTNPAVGVIASGSGLFMSTRAAALIGSDNTGVGLKILDGASVSLPVLGISNWATGIHIPQDSGTPALREYAVAFDNNSINYSIENSGTTGFSNAYSPYLKASINPNSDFFIVNKDQNIITVADKGADFTSIAAANAAITTASATNQYVISVGPGVYFESNIQLQQYTSIVGENDSATIIYASNPALPIFLGNVNTSISNLTMLGSTTSGTYLIDWAESANDGAMQMNHVNIGNTWGIAKLHPSNGKTAYFAGFDVKLSTDTTLGTGFEIIGDPGYSGTSQCAIHLQSCLFGSLVAPNKFASVHGSGTVLQLDDVLVQATLQTSGSTGVEFYDASKVRMYNVALDGFGKAISNPNLGAASEIVGNAVTILRSLDKDIDILRLNTSGSIQGTFSRQATNIDSSLVTTLAGDPVDFSTLSVGEFHVGPTQSELTEISQLWREGSTMGLMSGGSITAGTGLNVLIGSGVGYVHDTQLIKLTWTGLSLSIPASGDNYIFINSSNAASYSTSPINGDVTKVLLGRAVTNATGVTYIENIPMQAEHFGNKIDEMLRDTFGGIVADGLVVSASGLNLISTEGEYYYSSNKWDVVDKNPVPSFYQFYHVSGNWFYDINTSGIVNNSQWDNGINLTGLTAGYYTKHGIYYSGPFDTHLLVFGQAQYSGLSLAQSAATPTPYSAIKDAVIHVADVIVQQGSGSIVDVDDTRPVPSYRAPSSVSSGGGVTVHSQLLGLSSDDHTQYLLVNGTRSMTGSLDLGTNSIVNASGVNGVIVEAHASRHLPNGADALSTGAPSTIDLTNTINSAGVANSLSKSDHAHATSYVPVNKTGDMMTGNLTISGSNILATGTAGDIGSSTIPFGTVYANRFVESSPTGYVFAYSTGTQTVAAPSGVFQNITFSHSPVKSGWTHTSGTADFTCLQDGIYEASYTATTNRTAGISTAISIIATLGGVEIAGSQSVTTHAANNVPAETSNQIIFQAFSGNIFRTQLAATTTTSQIVGAGSGTTRPSIRLSIHKL